jgi:hypothetical protein
MLETDSAKKFFASLCQLFLYLYIKPKSLTLMAFLVRKKAARKRSLDVCIRC